MHQKDPAEHLLRGLFFANARPLCLTSRTGKSRTQIRKCEGS